MNGLPTSEANDMIQASDGFLWIGSYGGLVRYDGNTFERMDQEAGVNGVRSLFEDSKKRLWIGSTDKGAVMMERGKFRHWDDAGEFSTTAAVTIAEDDNGLIYLGTFDGPAVINAEMELKPITDERIAGKNIYELKKSADGVVYGLTHNGDVFTLRNGKVEEYLSDAKNKQIFGDSVQSILPVPDKAGKLIVAASDGLFTGTFKSGFEDMKRIELSPLGNVIHIVDVEGKVWICAANGVGLLMSNSNQIAVISDVPMNNSFGHVLRDYQSNLWFTSSRQGIMKLVRNQFTDLNRLWKLEHTVVNATSIIDDTFYIGADTGLYVIDDNGVLERLEVKTDGQNGEETADLIGLYKDTRIRSLYVDSGKRLWISDWGKYGLSYLKDGKIIFIEELRKVHVRNVCEMKDGSYAAAVDGGLVVIENDKVVRRYDKKDGIANVDSLNVAVAENGDILLGSDGGGLYVISGDSVTNIGKNDGLSSGVVMRIKATPHNCEVIENMI